jgi:predicted nuclease of predicted toxin-antitoxin system
VRVKLDENLGRRGADLLCQAGHEVATVPEQSLCSATDRELIEACRREGRCLVTLDLDFANPLVFPPRNQPGVAVLRLPHKPTPLDLELALQTLIAALVEKPVSGKLWIVEKGRIRETKTPSMLMPDRSVEDLRMRLRPAGYDVLSRPQQLRKTIAGDAYTTSTSYDTTFGRPETVTYPSGVQTKDIYSVNGYLWQVVNAATGAPFWVGDLEHWDLDTAQELLGNGVV